MADLSYIQMAQEVKVTGQDSAGTTVNYVGADANGNLTTKDVVNTSGVYGALSITTSAAEAKIGGSKLANRKGLTVTPTNGTIYWGYDASVTTTTGTPIFANSTWHFGIGVSVFLIAAQTTDVRVTEGA